MVKRVVEYRELKEGIQGIEDRRARGLCSIMYATASRIGELLPYNHKYKIIERGQWTGQYRKEETGGLERKAVLLGPDGVTVTLNNFKNKKRIEKDTFISNKRELWLCELIEDYVAHSTPGVLFPFKRNTGMALIKEALGITSHTLRHSRLTHLVRHFGLGNYEIKAIAGHASLETSAVYVHLDIADLKRKLENPVFKEGLE